MTLSTALRNKLTGTAAISALVGTRVYPNRLPQAGAYPAITFNLTVTPVEQMGAVPAVLTAYGVAMCFATTYEGADALAKAVYDALEHFGGVMGGAGGVTVIGTLVTEISSAVDDLVPGETVWTSSVDFTINYAA